MKRNLRLVLPSLGGPSLRGHDPSILPIWVKQSTSQRAASSFYSSSTAMAYCSSICSRKGLLLSNGIQRAQSSPFSSSGGGTPSDDHTNLLTQNDSNEQNPLETLQQAIASLEDFSTKLRQLAQQVDEPHTITVQSLFQSEELSLADFTLHSRDVMDLQEFQSPLAQAARKKLRIQAQEVEASLQNLVELYKTTVQPQMERATKLCQETPCGGATWELDVSRLQQQQRQQSKENAEEKETAATSTSTQQSPDRIQRVTLTGEHGTVDGTPCGRLQVASLQFLETTLETKPQCLMASRARILLELAMEFNAPLQAIRKTGTAEQKQSIQTTFQSQVLPTPWIRSDAEYQELMKIKQGLSLEKGDNE